MQALAKGLPIMYNNVVKRISYDQSGVQVTAGNTVIAADAVVVTVPLGVLKKDSIKFEPALPERKLQAIRRLGFGVLNKVSRHASCCCLQVASSLQTSKLTIFKCCLPRCISFALYTYKIVAGASLSGC